MTPALASLSPAQAAPLPIEQPFETKIQTAVTLFTSVQPVYLDGVNGQKLAAWNFLSTQPVPVGTILIVQGYTETAQKYSELIYDFVSRGFDVFTYDHRGMGESGRLAKHPQIVHVEKFQNYVADLSMVIRKFVNPRLRTQGYGLFAHSMGGLVSTLALLDLEKELRPHHVALTGPLFEMNTSPFSNNLTYYLTTALSLIGFGDRLAPARAFIRKEDIQNLGNYVTTSEQRRAVQLALFTSRENALMAGPSNQWVSEGIKATQDLQKKLLKAQQEEKDPFAGIPIELFAPGKDFLVNQGGFRRFCDLAPSCVLQFLPESMHEVMNERDVIRTPVFEKLVETFRS